MDLFRFQIWFNGEKTKVLCQVYRGVSAAQKSRSYPGIVGCKYRVQVHLHWNVYDKWARRVHGFISIGFEFVYFSNVADEFDSNSSAALHDGEIN